MARKRELLDLDLNEVRYKIIKSMLTEFPELKIQLTKSVLIEAKKSAKHDLEEEASLSDYLYKIAKNSMDQQKSSNQGSRLGLEDSEDSLSDWAKLAMASKNNKGNGKYYFFGR